MKVVWVVCAVLAWVGLFGSEAIAQRGIASEYCDKRVAWQSWHKGRMHCRELTAAHRTLKFGTHVLVTYKNRSVEVVITDRGPAKRLRARIIDLSTGAARALHLPGLGRVTVAVITTTKAVVRVETPPAEIISAPVEPPPTVVVQDVPSPVPSPVLTASPAAPQESDMDWAPYVMKGFALLGMVVSAWYVGKVGFQAGRDKLAGWFSVAKADFDKLEARVKLLEGNPNASPAASAPSASSTGVASSHSG